MIQQGFFFEISLYWLVNIHPRQSYYNYYMNIIIVAEYSSWILFSLDIYMLDAMNISSSCVNTCVSKLNIISNYRIYYRLLVLLLIFRILINIHLI